MSRFLIKGSNRLYGEVNVTGAKNSALPMLAATILCKGQSVLHNCPNLADVKTSVKILEKLGCKCNRENSTITVDATNINDFQIPEELMREMRSSIVFLGAIVGRCNKALLSSPGGCELGPRPIDLHLSALRKMGVQIKEEYGRLKCECKDKLKGCEISLIKPSVGATENIILAACTANGITVIRNAAREPEICDLAEFLNLAGAKISGAGTSTVIIEGVSLLCGCEHTIIPDRIVAATYMNAAAATRGDVLIKNVSCEHLSPVLANFLAAGCKIDLYDDSLRIKTDKPLKRIECINSMAYPGFPTDSGPTMMAMLSIAKGTSIFVENIFTNRYKFTDELKRLGSKISIVDKVAIIEGVESLTGASVEATDLRGGAALVVAGLVANGTTTINNIFHIDRGYENIEIALLNLGADIKRTDN